MGGVEGLFKVDPASKVPIYLQLKENIRHLISSGQLAPDERLPTVRQLAVDLAVNPNTVGRVYSELTSEGYLEARQGSGTFVREVGKELKERRRFAVTESLRESLCEALNLGYEPDDLIQVVIEEVKALSGRRNPRDRERLAMARPDLIQAAQGGRAPESGDSTARRGR